MKQLAYKSLLCILLLAVFTAHGQTDVLHLKSNVTDTIFGNVVEDPYRWMEAPESDSLNQWLKEQKKLAKAEQSHFNGRMSDAAYNAWHHSGYEYTKVEKRGGRFFAYAGPRLVHGQSWVLYSRRNEHESYKVAFDPNEIEWNHPYDIKLWSVSDSGNNLAVVLSRKEGDWEEIRIRDLDSMQYYNDVIAHVKVSDIVWWRDGFFYGRYPDDGRWDTAGPQQLFYHKLGQKQDKDQLISSSPSGAGYRDIKFNVTSNQKYLVSVKNQKIGKALYNIMAYKDLAEGIDAAWKHIVRVPAEDTCYYKLIDYADSGFLLYSNYMAPHGRVLMADMDEANHFYEIIHENENVIDRVTYVHHQLVVLYFTAGQYMVNMYNDTGGLVDGIRFSPGLSVSGFNRFPGDTETIFYEHSFYIPPVVYRYNFIAKKATPVDKTKVTFNINDYTTDIVHYKADDGTDVPMFITYKKGLVLKGNNAVILTGYGSFGETSTPFYRYSNITLFESGGILAVPMVRGGGEEGAGWHAGGRKFNKQNSFDDFAAAARYLIKEGFTSKDKLAIEGNASGGLLATAFMVQHPDLCKVVVSSSGVYDMLRYHRFTNGKYWKEEYGTPDNPDDFKNLLGYSPLHNLKPGVNYPATLFIAGRNDEYVVPMHTYKFLARLQECSTGHNPHLLYFEEDFKRSEATGFIDRSDESAYILAFIFTQMHLHIKYLY